MKSNNATVYAIIGTKGQGKDTFADFLCAKLAEPETVIHRVAFGDFLKDALALILPVPREDFDDQSKKEVYNSDIGTTLRYAMCYASDALKSVFGPDMFVKAMEYRIANLPSDKRTIVVITDVRFKNEFDFVSNLKHSHMCFVHRNADLEPNTNAHESEHGLYREYDKFDRDHFWIDNRFDMDYLDKQSSALVACTNPWYPDYETLLGD